LIGFWLFDLLTNAGTEHVDCVGKCDGARAAAIGQRVASERAGSAVVFEWGVAASASWVVDSVRSAGAGQLVEEASGGAGECGAGNIADEPDVGGGGELFERVGKRKQFAEHSDGAESGSVHQCDVGAEFEQLGAECAGDAKQHMRSGRAEHGSDCGHRGGRDSWSGLDRVRHSVRSVQIARGRQEENLRQKQT
jgi:hypothetical protein